MKFMEPTLKPTKMSDFTVEVCTKHFESLQLLKDTLDNLFDGFTFISEKQGWKWLVVRFRVDE